MVPTSEVTTATERVLADRVEDDVVRLAVPSEVLLGVVDDLVGAERPHDLDVLRVAHCSHVRIEVPGQLHRRSADRPRRAVDEDSLPLAETYQSQAGQCVDHPVADCRSLLEGHVGGHQGPSEAVIGVRVSWGFAPWSSSFLLRWLATARSCSPRVVGRGPSDAGGDERRSNHPSAAGGAACPKEGGAPSKTICGAFRPCRRCLPNRASSFCECGRMKSGVPEKAGAAPQPGPTRFLRTAY